LANEYVGKIPNTVSYHVRWGDKYKGGDSVDYASPALVGDKITMTIDLRLYKNRVSFAKNGNNMGVAYSGLNFWGSEIYPMFSILKVGHRIKVLNYELL